MNYYNEIKNELINNEINRKIKNYSINRSDLNNYYNMIDEKEYDESILREACCYSGICKQQNRKGCATIPWKGIEKAIKTYEAENQ